MTVLRLAMRNVLGAGLKTWLNVAVLSLAFVVIVWVQGFYDGVNQQALDAIIDIEYAGGQFWHEEYDKFDPLTLEQSHGKITPDIQKMIDDGNAFPILTTLGAIYPQGRMISVMIKGVQTDQDIIPLPSHVLENGDSGVIPALIGTRMAEAGEIEQGDFITMRWRDANGTFDATDVKIVEIMNTIAPSIDAGQIWIPIEKLREAMQMPDEATVITVRKGYEVKAGEFGAFYFMLPEKLLEDMIKIIEGRDVFWLIMYSLLSGLGLLAIFDTQILAVFRRRKEMGMLMALGMTRREIIGTFTLEGFIQGVFSVIVAFIWGSPLCYWTLKTGFRFGNIKEGGGFAIPTVVYPDYHPTLVFTTIFVLLFFITLVSFWPARRIVKLKPTDALRGRWS